MMNFLLSPGEQHFPRLTYLGSASDPRFISLNCKDELCVLTYAVLINLLSRSNICSNILTPLGLKFPFWMFAWCSSSYIMAHLKVSSFIRHSKICWSSSNTLILLILSRTKGLKSNSIEHLLFVGISLATEAANKSATTFFNLWIEMISNASKFVSKSHTSFW